jgi:hypothetical protein
LVRLDKKGFAHLWLWNDTFLYINSLL